MLAFRIGLNQYGIRYGGFYPARTVFPVGYLFSDDVYFVIDTLARNDFSDFHLYP